MDAQACGSLSFYLFSKHVREAAGVSNFPTASDDWPAATHVRIEQPKPEVLRIVALDGSHPAPSRVLASRELVRQRGDFECEGDEIRLKPRVERDFQLWFGRRTHTEYLALRAEPDALVVSSTRQYDSYLMWMVGGTMREESDSHRWLRIPPD
jgi:hypothetical protein